MWRKEEGPSAATTKYTIPGQNEIKLVLCAIFNSSKTRKSFFPCRMRAIFIRLLFLCVPLKHGTHGPEHPEKLLAPFFGRFVNQTEHILWSGYTAGGGLFLCYFSFYQLRLLQRVFLDRRFFLHIFCAFVCRCSSTLLWQTAIQIHFFSRPPSSCIMMR